MADKLTIEEANQLIRDCEQVPVAWTPYGRKLLDRVVQAREARVEALLASPPISDSRADFEAALPRGKECSP